jgi:hypothetical protein
MVMMMMVMVMVVMMMMMMMVMVVVMMIHSTYNPSHFFFPFYHSQKGLSAPEQCKRATSDS